MSLFGDISWSLSYIDPEGIVHYLTPDGLPPNNGYPAPPGYELRVLPAPAVSPRSPSPIPQLRPIASYILRPVVQPLVIPPTQFVNINFISHGVRPHRDKFTGRNRDEEIPYTVCRAATNMKMKDLIIAFEGGEARGFTECKLLSDGRSWAEVQTFKLGDNRSEMTLEEVGWTESRGVDGPPVWVCAYHEGLDAEEEKSYWEGLGFPAS